MKIKAYLELNGFISVSKWARVFIYFLTWASQWPNKTKLDLPKTFEDSLTQRKPMEWIHWGVKFWLKEWKNYRWHCWSFITKGFVPVLKQVQYFCLPFLQSSLNFGVDFCFSSNFYLLICLFDCFSFEGSQCRDLGGNWLTTVCLYCNCNFSYRKLLPPSSLIVHHPIQTQILIQKQIQTR